MVLFTLASSVFSVDEAKVNKTRVDYLTENTDEANVNKTRVDYLTENTSVFSVR
jgi:hypothetical protein